jgi:hypothetical protein
MVYKRDRRPITTPARAKQAVLPQHLKAHVTTAIHAATTAKENNGECQLLQNASSPIA